MRIEKLDGLRGVFSVMVVFFHISSEFMPKVFYQNFFIRESEIFVDFFFVLSGFVIAYNYQSLSNYNAFKIYMKKRFARIYPLLFWSAIVFFAIYTLFTYLNLTNISSLEQGKLVNRLIDTLILTNSTPILGVSLGINYPSWSISSEMISYTLFGLTSIFLLSYRKWVKYAILIIVSLIFLMYIKEYWVKGDFGFVRGLYAFTSGYFVYKFYNDKISFRSSLEYLVLSLVVLQMYILSILQGETLELFSMFTIPLLFSIVVYVLLHTNGCISKILEGRFFQFLGKISYSIYLNHAIIIVLVPKAILYIHPVKLDTTTQLLIIILTLGILVMYSYFTYIYIEKMVGKNLRKRLLKLK